MNCAIILAGGEGKRMGSQKPKALSLVLGKPMLQWVLNAVRESEIEKICIVKGYKKEEIELFTDSLSYPVETVYQSERLGTGHAVMMAKDFLCRNKGNVVVLNGDSPFIDSETIKSALLLHISSKASATVISAEVEDPDGYGRVIRKEDGSLYGVMEQKDADAGVLKIKEVNSGCYWFDTENLLSVLDKITSANKAGEYYLPDTLKLLSEKNAKISVFKASSPYTVLGANDPEQLKELNRIAQNL